MTRQEATTFYRTHSKALYNTALRIVRDSAEAEEIMQDALMRYFEKGVRSATVPQAARWLQTTCVRMSIDALRRRKKWMDITATMPSEDMEPEAELPETMDIMQVKSAMERLPHPYSLILDLILIEGMEYSEIARMTGQKVTTLRSWYSRGRARLVKELKTQTII